MKNHAQYGWNNNSFKTFYSFESHSVIHPLLEMHQTRRKGRNKRRGPMSKTKKKKTPKNKREEKTPHSNPNPKPSF